MQNVSYECSMISKKKNKIVMLLVNKQKYCYDNMPAKLTKAFHSSFCLSSQLCSGWHMNKKGLNCTSQEVSLYNNFCLPLIKYFLENFVEQGIMEQAVL